MLRATYAVRSVAFHRYKRSFAVIPSSVKANRKKEYSMAAPTMQPLNYFDGPLVWVDCEMTGLNPNSDSILEIAVLITNGNLEIVDDGVEFIIKTSKGQLDGMDAWCTKQHASTGLTQAALESTLTTQEVSKLVLDYIKKWIPKQRVGVLAGNSVHADRSFLVKEMPDVTDWLHYRIVDVSSVKELCRRWYPHRGIPRLGDSQHRALSDIRGSILELEWYRKNIFLPSEGLAQGELKSKAPLQPPVSGPYQHVPTARTTTVRPPTPTEPSKLSGST